MKARGKVEAAVEVPLELCQVAWEVPSAHPAAPAEQAALQTAQDGIRSGEGRVLGRAPTAVHHLHLVTLQEAAYHLILPN